MKTKSIATISKLGFMAILLFSTPLIAKGAFGISPPWIQYNYLKPGTTYNQVITLSTDDASKDKIITPSKSGDAELINWIKIINGNDLKIRKGEKTLPVIISIEVPENAVEKKYTAFVTFSMSGADKANGLDLNLGANVKIDVAVSKNNVTDYRVRSVSSGSLSSMAGEPIFLELKVENKGNIPLEEVPVSVEVWNESEKSMIQKISASKLLNPIPAYTSGIAQIKIEPEITEGNYWIRSKVLKAGKMIYENKMFLAIEPFSTPSSTVATSLNVGTNFMGNLLGESGSVSVSTSLRVKSPYETPLMIATLLLAALLAGFGIFKFRKRHH